MYNSDGWKPMGGVDIQRGAPAEISADAPSVSVWISNIIQIWCGRQKVAVEIQKKILRVLNTDNLIISLVHVFCSNFSQVRMFCDDNHLKLVPEYTHFGVL